MAPKSSARESIAPLPHVLANGKKQTRVQVYFLPVMFLGAGGGHLGTFVKRARVLKDAHDNKLK